MRIIDFKASKTDFFPKEANERMHYSVGHTLYHINNFLQYYAYANSEESGKLRA